MFVLHRLRYVETCCTVVFFFLMIRRPPRSTLDRSSAASDVYKRQVLDNARKYGSGAIGVRVFACDATHMTIEVRDRGPVSYTHLRAHETVLDLVCRLLLEKKNQYTRKTTQFVE